MTAPRVQSITVYGIGYRLQPEHAVLDPETNNLFAHNERQ
jgi:hypothetical protein